MRIVTVGFDYQGTDSYARLLRVYEHTVREHMPTASLEVIKIPAPKGHTDRQRSFVSNTAKLREWVRVVKEASPDDQIAFTDCDMMMVGDISDAFDHEFDVAYTRRRAKLPMNGGVVFARPTQAAVEFFQLWGEWNDRFFANPSEHRPWRMRYGGMNQSAFGKVYEDTEYKAMVIALPCEIYNAIDSDWDSLTEDCRMIHCKSNLRRAIFTRHPKGKNTRFSDATILLARRWQSIERNILKKEIVA